MTDATSAHVVLDQSACLREQANVGATIIHNVCTGATATVPWGSADWMGFFALCGVGAIFAVIFTCLAGLIWSSVRDSY